MRPLTMGPIAALLTARRVATGCFYACMVGLLLVAVGCAGSGDQAVATAPDDAEPSPTQAPQTEAIPATSAPVLPAPALVTVEVTPLPSAVPDRSAQSPTRPAVLMTGTEGAVVEDTQDLLNDFIGYTDLSIVRIAEDAVFGPNTEAAQRNFEQYAGLEVDGVASEADRTALVQTVDALEADRATSVVALGDESTFVGSWQNRLNIWNDLVLEQPQVIAVDDRFGEDTEQATLAVERALGLQVDGIVEPEDRAALRNQISQLRAEQDVTVLRRALVGDTTVVAKTLFVNNQFCIRFVVGFAADERCTPTAGGDINTAYFVTVNGVSFVGGTANPNVAFVQLGVRGQGTTPVATRQIGDSLARAWVEIVDQEPDTIELLESDGTSVMELRFSIAPTDREFFGSTVSVLSPAYTQSFFVDECIRPSADELVVSASLASARMVINVQGDTGSLAIQSGTELAPVELAGTITSADTGSSEVIVTGRFTSDVLDDAVFTASLSC